MELLNLEPKPLNWKKERVESYLRTYKEKLNRRCPLGYPALMGMITRWVEEVNSYPDEQTGEIQFEIPPIEEWNEQLNGFFKDEFARANRGFHFTYFLKQYGSFVKPDLAPKKTRSITDYYCITCKRTHKVSEVCPSEA